MHRILTSLTPLSEANFRLIDIILSLLGGTPQPHKFVVALGFGTAMLLLLLACYERTHRS
jgi:hypothetical protein